MPCDDNTPRTCSIKARFDLRETVSNPTRVFSIAMARAVLGM